MCSPDGPPARRGHRFLFRKKAVGKNGPGEGSPGAPSKYAPTGVEVERYLKCQTKTSRQRRKALTDMGTHLC